MYALAAILRNFPEAQSMFFRSGGLEVFQQVFSNTNHHQSHNLDKVKIKILTLIQDFWDERNNPDLELAEAGEKKRQYDETDILSYLQNSGWCSVYDASLLVTKTSGDDEMVLEHDRVEKVVTNMLNMKSVCSTTFQQNIRLRDSLKYLENRYENILEINQEDSDYFRIILHNIQDVLYNHLRKDEL